MGKRQLRWVYMGVDVLAALIVWALFMIFRYVVRDQATFGNLTIFIPNYNFNSGLVLFSVCCLFVHALSGVYLHPELQRQVRLIPVTFVASAIISVSIFFVLLLDDVVVSYTYYYWSLLVLFVLLFVVTYAFRAVVCWLVWRNYRAGRWGIRSIVVGTGGLARKIAKEITERMPEYKVLGHVAEERALPHGDVLGGLNRLEDIVRDQDVQDVVIALERCGEKQLFSLLNVLFRYGVSIRFVPTSYDILIGSVRMTELGVSPLVSITSLGMKDWEACVKRFFDLSVSLLALVVLSPLFLLLGVWIKCDSRGPVFYRQERIGRYGHPFRIIKFRTMYVDAERGGVPRLSSSADKRVTRVGHVLRRYRLDELPQFWNILKGEMSIVGPRPERRYYIRQIMEHAPYYCLVYRVRPGLTSWGPIRVGYTDTVDKMVERLNYDIIYMDNMSLKTDLKILLFTFEVIIKGKGV